MATSTIAIGRLPALGLTQEEELKNIGKQLQEDFKKKLATERSKFVDLVLKTNGRLKGTLNNISYYITEPELALSKKCILEEISLAQDTVEKMFVEIIEWQLIDELEEQFSRIAELHSPELVSKTALHSHLKEAGCSDADIYNLIFVLPKQGFSKVAELGVKITLDKSIETDWSKEIEVNIKEPKPSSISNIGAGVESLTGALELGIGVATLFLGGLAGLPEAVLEIGHGLKSIGKEVEHFS